VYDEDGSEVTLIRTVSAGGLLKVALLLLLLTLLPVNSWLNGC
jgi:hypothetical protein